MTPEFHANRQLDPPHPAGLCIGEGHPPPTAQAPFSQYTQVVPKASFNPTEPRFAHPQNVSSERKT